MPSAVDPNPYLDPAHDPHSLAGRVAVVTGAGSRADGIGNGRASAIVLARRGAKVALIDSEPDWVARTLAMIEAEGLEAGVFVGDVTDDASCRSMVEAIVARWGPPRHPGEQRRHRRAGRQPRSMSISPPGTRRCGSTSPRWS